MLFFSFLQVYSISNQMFACVSPHFHKDVILREREFDLEYLAFFRDVYLIQDTELTFPPFSTHYLHYRFLRRIMWHALLWKKVAGAKRWRYSSVGWGPRKRKISSPFLTDKGKPFLFIVSPRSAYRRSLIAVIHSMGTWSVFTNMCLKEIGCLVLNDTNSAIAKSSGNVSSRSLWFLTGN